MSHCSGAYALRRLVIFDLLQVCMQSNGSCPHRRQQILPLLSRHLTSEASHRHDPSPGGMRVRHMTWPCIPARSPPSRASRRQCCAACSGSPRESPLQRRAALCARPLRAAAQSHSQHDHGECLTHKPRQFTLECTIHVVLVLRRQNLRQLLRCHSLGLMMHHVCNLCSLNQTSKDMIS